MNRYLIKIRHLTWRRVLNKVWQMISNLSVSFTLRKVPKKNISVYERLDTLTKDISESNGSAYYEKAYLKIGVITDEFMYNYYKDAVRLIPVGHDNYREIIDNAEIDILMYISCWRGMSNDDWYGDLLHGDVPDAVRYANDRNVTTIFQSIEDPTNYERYLPIAAVCDYIFTTDSDCLERYKNDTGNDKVFLLEYGVNPHFHNPIGIYKQNDKSEDYDNSTVFFAGSWMDRYKNRCRDIRLIFDGVMDSGENLMVADRNVDVTLPGYRFPRAYQPFTVPAIEHHLLQKVHKLFKFNVNVNTVQDSPTMCAMRVYELQALGCLMLSNYALSLSEQFPGVFMINNKEEVREILQKYSETELYRMKVENLRNVMTDKTVYDRLNYIFQKCGIDHKFPDRNVTVLCEEKTPDIVEMFERQRYENKTLMISDHYDPKEKRSDFIAFFDQSHGYGDWYLTDMMNGFKYCDVDFVTKDPGCKGYEYDFVDSKADKSMTVMKSGKYEEMIGAGDNAVSGKGFKLDYFEIDERVEMKNNRKEIAVIVPVYNNGTYLHGRCFRSLLRSSIFEKMQIYLIDDGSDDGETIETIKALEKRYENVTAYFFEQGGSGSAARPRNKGIEISSEPYITYLDPDNEAINDGYFMLYEKIKATRADMVFGAILTRETSEKLTRMGYLFKDKLEDDPKDLLVSENFRVQSIQACLIKRELITDHKLENPEGAFGEDTMFFMELMINAGRVYYINKPIHIYYAQRRDSSINDVGTEFFRKSLILEEYQARKLKEYGLFETYVEKKLDYFIINWYIDKLSAIRESSGDIFAQCVEMIDAITRLYGKAIEDYSEHIGER